MNESDLWIQHHLEHRWTLCCGKCGEPVGYWERDKAPKMCPQCSCMVSYPQSTASTTTTANG